MGDEPDRIRRVPVEPAAELVVNSAVGHPVQGVANHPRRPGVAGRDPPQEEVERHRLRELGSAAPGAVQGVEARLERRLGVPNERRGGGRAVGRQLVLLVEGLGETLPGRHDLESVFVPRPSRPGQHLAK